jgi:hypothetical protein
LVTHAYLQFGHKFRIQRYTKKIFKYFIDEKKQDTIPYWQEIQFIMLKQLNCPSHKQSVAVYVDQLMAEIYSSEEKVEQSLLKLLK